MVIIIISENAFINYKNGVFMSKYQKLYLWLASINHSKLLLAFLLIKLMIGGDGDGSPPGGI
jgi:hypothetical protein